jgi:DNA-binding response OmpR family regulator
MTDEYTWLLDRSSEDEIVSVLRLHCAGQRASRVLIVEDKLTTAQAARRALEKYYRVDVAADGTSALLLWRNTRHDIVLLDLGLPDQPGTSVLQSLLSEAPDQLVIVLTAQDSAERHSELVLAGAQQFLAKPIDLHFLPGVCARALRDRACLRNAENSVRSVRSQQVMATHVHAASLRLERGQAAMASAHLRHALAASRTSGPSDDQWTELLSEFQNV